MHLLPGPHRNTALKQPGSRLETVEERIDTVWKTVEQSIDTADHKKWFTHVDVGGPIFRQRVGVGVGVQKIDRTAVIGQGVEPHVHDVVVAAWNGDAPFEIVSGQRQIS